MIISIDAGKAFGKKTIFIYVQKKKTRKLGIQGDILKLIKDIYKNP